MQPVSLKDQHFPPCTEKKPQNPRKLMALCIHLFRRISNFSPVSCCQQTLFDAWLLCLVLPVPLPKCAENPAIVIITMETCPVSTLLPWESTGAPQMYIFHLHRAESYSLWANDVPSPLPSYPGPWEQGTSPCPAGSLVLGWQEMTGRAAPLWNWNSGWRVPAWGCLCLRACKELLGSGAYRNDLLAEMFVRPTNLQRGQGKGEKPKPHKQRLKNVQGKEVGNLLNLSWDL